MRLVASGASIAAAAKAAGVSRQAVYADEAFAEQVKRARDLAANAGDLPPGGEVQDGVADVTGGPHPPLAAEDD